MIWMIVLFFFIAIGWAFVGEIDIVATAQGKIIPSGHVKVIQPLEIGVVRKIHVQEGDEVNAGDILVDLDPTNSGADEARLHNEILLSRLERARLRTLLAIIDHGDKNILESERANVENRIARRYAQDLRTTHAHVQEEVLPTKEALKVQEEILSNQYSEYKARMATHDQELARRKATLTTTGAGVMKLEEILPLVTRRAKAMKALFDQKMVAELDYLSLEQERVEKQQDLAAERSRLVETEAAVAASIEERAVADAEFRRARLLELAEAERKIAGLLEEIVKARQRTNLQQLRSPIAGVVEKLAIHTTGGVVTPAQELMQIVPVDKKLEVEAWVQNKDIGFVHEGQVAEVKVETFPFTKYGTIDAEIENLSNDAVSSETLGLVYATRVLLKKSVMMVEGRLINLAPGMAVTVEVKTGKRRIVEFVLSPLLRGMQESARER
jgi:hemolysin D